MQSDLMQLSPGEFLARCLTVLRAVADDGVSRHHWDRDCQAIWVEARSRGLEEEYEALVRAVSRECSVRRRMIGGLGEQALKHWGRPSSVCPTCHGGKVCPACGGVGMHVLSACDHAGDVWECRICAGSGRCWTCEEESRD